MFNQRFKVTKRRGKFLNFNPKNEHKKDELIPCADITIEYQGTKRDFDVLFPHPTKAIKLSEVFWEGGKRLAVPYIKLQNLRTPENIMLTIYDQETKRSKPLVFEPCTVKKIERLELKERNVFTAALRIRIHDDPEAHSARLRALMDIERDFELEAQQEDFWDDADDDTEQAELGLEEEEGEDDEDSDADEAGDEEEGDEDEEEEDDED